MNKQSKENLEYEEYLISQGLAKKVYFNLKNGESPNNYRWEYDPVLNTRKYYKIMLTSSVPTPAPITNNEYNKINEMTYKQKDNSTNKVAKLLKSIAWIIFVLGFVLGILCSITEVPKSYYSSRTETTFSIVTALVFWVITLINGSFFLALSEIIKLLNDIKNK